MNNYIYELSSFFFDFAVELEKTSKISSLNKKNINIDYLSTNKKGDLASNFYLIIKKKIIDKSFDFENELNKRITRLHFIDKLIISNNGFINIFLKDEFVKNKLEEIYNKSFINFIKFGNNQNLNIEFVSANPTGPVHIAHLRGAVLGDVLSNLYEKTGFNVTREYYVNDAGSQVTKLTNSLYKRYLELLGHKIELSSDEYPGQYLIEIAEEILSKDKDKWTKQNNEDVFLYFRNYALKKLLENIKSDLNLLNISFDVFTHETDIEKSKIIEKLFKILEKKNLIYKGLLPKPKADDIDWEPREQLLFRSSKLYDDQDRALKKSNNEWTYFANDAAYHYDKFIRKFDKLINVWGSDHIGYIPRMKSLINSFQNNDYYFEVLTCQIVSLIQNKKKIKMSKRDGNFVTLADIFQQVGKDPIRYYMISTKNETSIDFDMDEVIKKNKDNKVFYCQYAYARASSVINKSIDLKININKIENLDFKKYLTDDEWVLIKDLISYPYLLVQSCKNKEPHKLVNYLENICSQFHSIWNKGKDNTSLRFIDENEINHTKTKLFWIECFRIILNDIFTLIGIDSPEKM